jgi:hypothetical protein
MAGRTTATVTTRLRSATTASRLRPTTITRGRRIARTETRSGLASLAGTLTRVRYRLRRRVSRVRLALRVLPARLDPLARPVSRDRPDLRAHRGSPALLALPDLRVLRGRLVLRVRLVPLAQPVRPGRKVRQGSQVRPARAGSLGLPVPLVRPVLPDLRAARLVASPVPLSPVACRRA